MAPFAMTEPEKTSLRSGPPRFDFKSLPMYAEVDPTDSVSGIV